MKHKYMRRGLGLVLSVAMLIGSALPAFAVVPVAKDNQLPAASQPGYISVHEYISPTDMEDVYKVTLSVKGINEDPKETRVVAVIDASSSMNQTDKNVFYDSQSNYLNRWLQSTTGHLQWDDYQRVAMGLGAWPATQAAFTDAEIGWPTMTNHGRVGGAVLITGGLQPSWGGSPYYNEWAQWSNFEPETTWKKPVANTRLDAAMDGAKAAVDAFLDKANNPAAEVTSFGVAGFSSFDALIDEEPYVSKSATFGYGFGEGTTKEPWLNAIRYSTRRIDSAGNTVASILVGGTPVTSNSTSAPVAGTPFPGPDLFALLENSGYVAHQKNIWTTNPPNPKLKNGKPTKSSFKELVEYGLLPYDAAGAGRAVLKKDIDTNVWADPMTTTTEIIKGLEEAEKMLFGPEGGHATGAIDPVTTINTDGVRRFVIFLSDGGENPVVLDETFELINKMKAAGVEFMVVGIDTELGMDPILGANGKHDPNTVDWDKTKDPLIIGQHSAPPTTPYDAFEQYLAWMGSKLESYASIPAGSVWSAVTANYASKSPTDPSLPNYVGITKYKYVDGSQGGMSAQIKTAFQEFVNEIIFMGHDAKADLELSKNFDVYQMPNKPRFEFTGTPGQTVKESGGALLWDHNGGLPLTGENTLTFYVKVSKTGAMTGGFSTVFAKANYSVIGPFVDPTQTNRNRPWPDVMAVKKFEGTYASTGDAEEIQAKKEQKQNDVIPDQPVAETKTVSAALPVVGGLGSVAARADAEITGVDSKQLKTGKTQVSVSVKNGSEMYYQWQYQDESKQWADIFGANSSTYTLGGKFKAGQKYKLRCVVTNAANKKFTSDVLEVTATKSSTSGEKLQSSK